MKPTDPSPVTVDPVQYRMNLKNSVSGDEELLVKTASKGDLDAFNQLILIHQNKVYNHAYALLGENASAEDATRECFIKAFQSISRFRSGSSQETHAMRPRSPVGCALAV